jgi:hypothetical protein
MASLQVDAKLIPPITPPATPDSDSSTGRFAASVSI